MAKSKPVILYSVRADSAHPNMYYISKLSADFEVLASYVITESGPTLICNCPAYKPWCKHCEILRIAQAEHKVGTGAFYNHDSKEWLPPLTTGMF